MGARTHAASLLVVFFLCAAAHAAVYRCGTRYQDTPCAGASTIQAEDPRTPQQQLEAARAVQQDAALANALEKQRLQRETQQARQQQAAYRAHLAQEAEAAKQAKAQAALDAKAEAERQKELSPHKITTRKAPLPKASAAKAR